MITLTFIFGSRSASLFLEWTNGFIHSSLCFFSGSFSHSGQHFLRWVSWWFFVRIHLMHVKKRVKTVQWYWTHRKWCVRCMKECWLTFHWLVVVHQRSKLTLLIVSAETKNAMRQRKRTKLMACSLYEVYLMKIHTTNWCKCQGLSYFFPHISNKLNWTVIGFHY